MHNNLYGQVYSCIYEKYYVAARKKGFSFPPCWWEIEWDLSAQFFIRDKLIHLIHVKAADCTLTYISIQGFFELWNGAFDNVNKLICIDFLFVLGRAKF